MHLDEQLMREEPTNERIRCLRLRSTVEWALLRVLDDWITSSGTDMYSGVEFPAGLMLRQWFSADS
jgi:hypothetical protein